MALDRDRVLQNAAKLVDKKKYDKAIAEYQKLVQEDPSDSRTLLKIGDIQSRMGDYEHAIATYDRVATRYATQGFQLKAIAVFKQIRELIRKHAPELQARYSHITPRLADIYAELNLITDALAAYDEVATMYQKAGRDLDAIAVFEKTVLLDPKNPLPHLRLAEARCRVKMLDEAIDSFWTAAELLLGLKRPDDALKVIERILHFRQDPVYARAAAQLYLQKNSPQAGMQALARLQIAFQANPKDLDTLALLAQAFEVIQQSDKALEVHLEMARLAREQRRPELWHQILAHLRHVAPGNPQVVALDRAGPPLETGAPPPISAPPKYGAPQAASLPQRTPPPRSAPPLVEVEEVDAVDLDSDVTYLEDAEEETEVELISSAPPPAGTIRASRPPSVSSPSIRGSQPDFDDDDGIPVSDAAAIEAHERGAPQSFQPSTHAHKALSDAESFRFLGLLDKAVEALHIALEIDPNSVPIRQKLREILVEAGEREGAIQETLNIAIIHIHNQSPDDAEPLALEVLEIEPEHPDALNILDHVAVLRENFASMQDEESLSSYDMEGVRPSRAINRIPSAPQLPEEFAVEPPVSLRGPAPVQGREFDFPSSHRGLGPPPRAVPPPSPGRSVLPPPSLPPPPRRVSSLPPPSLGPPSASSALLRPSTAPLALGPPPSLGPPALGPPSIGAPTSSRRRASFAPGSLRAGARPSAEQIEEVLEEAEFFASQGLYADAEAILADMLVHAPNHLLLREQLNEVRAALLEEPPQERNEDRDSLIPEDNAFDIAASLDALDDLDEPETSPSMTSPDQEVDVDQVFAKFKEGVKAVVDDSDAATHHDLGLAYKEMGLQADAISEFELAARDPSRTCMCLAMIGMIYRDLGDTKKARDAFQEALKAEQKTREQELGIQYDIALLYQSEGAKHDYIRTLKAIAKMDPNYRDVGARIRALGEAVPERGEDQEQDEFDAAFDNLLG